MQLITILRTIGVFLSVALATFLASDPYALPKVWNAALIGIIAGLAAVGIKPPWAQETSSVIVTPSNDQTHALLKQVLENEKTL